MVNQKMRETIRKFREKLPDEFSTLIEQGAGEKKRLLDYLPESHHSLLAQLQVDIEALNGDSSYTFPGPATYVIAKSGEIAWAFAPNNYRKRAVVDDILGAVLALNSTTQQVINA